MPTDLVSLAPLRSRELARLLLALILEEPSGAEDRRALATELLRLRRALSVDDTVGECSAP